MDSECAREQMLNELESSLELMPADWLLDGEPFVKYRTLIDLSDREGSDEEVVATRRLVPKHRLIKQILDKRNKDGYWGTPRDVYTWWLRKDTTFWVLGMLADFGFTKADKRIAGACEYVLSTQLPSGGFGCRPPPKPYPCFTGILAESLARLGYASDSRLKEAYEWLTSGQRLDGGFWCKTTGLPGGPREKEPSCAFATLCVLGALAQDPELRNSTVGQRAADFMFRCWENRGTIEYTGHDSQIGKGWQKLKYAFTDYRILKYLDILSQLKLAKTDHRMMAMMNLLMAKRGEEGRFFPESVHRVWSDFDFGQKKAPSRWVTLIVYRIAKRVVSG